METRQQSKHRWHPRAAALSLCVAAVLLVGLVFGALPANAAVDVAGEMPATTAPTAGMPFLYTPQQAEDAELGSAAYTPSTTTYTGKDNYYFVTQDEQYDGQTGSGITVTYPLGSADPADQFTATVVYLADGEYDNTFESAYCKPNTTLFFDKGVYTDTHDNAAQYTRFSKENLSLVGLYPPVSGSDENATVFKRVPVSISYTSYLGSRTATGLLRYNFGHKRIRLENIVFDGDGQHMLTTPLTSGNQNKGNSHGNYLIHVAGNGTDNTDGFYMKNCVVRNLGTASSTNSPNVAINLARPAGQINFENVDIHDVKTSSSYSVVQLTLAQNVNLKNISIDMAAAGNKTRAIRMEHPDGSVTNEQQETQVLKASVAFDGGLAIENSTADGGYLYAQQYIYNSLVVPQGYRYATYATGTGKTREVRIYSEDDFGKITFNNSTAVYDLYENAWVARSGLPSLTVEAQLAAIRTVLNNLAAAIDPTTALAGGRGLSTDAHVKLVANEEGEIAPFTVPDFTAPNLGDIAVHIKAVSSSDAAYLPAVAEWLPLQAPAAGNAAIALDGATAGNVVLHGFDFHTFANYTLQEALGRAATAEGDGALAAGVPGSTAGTFAQCRFTGLVGAVAATADQYELTVGDTAQGAFEVSEVYTADAAPEAVGTPAVDDTAPGYEWTSSDEGVASVDPATGRITAVGEGTATITLSITSDAYNGGEIPLPFDAFEVTVRKPAQPASSTSKPTPSSSAPVSSRPASSSARPASSASVAPTPPPAPAASSVRPAAPSRGQQAAVSTPASRSTSRSGLQPPPPPPSGTQSSEVPAVSSSVQTGSISQGKNVPLFHGGGQYWALVNLILALLTVVVSVVLLVGLLRNRHRSLWRILGAVVGVVSIIVFFLTENMRLPMALFDFWTILMAVFVALQIVLVLLMVRTERQDDEDEEAYDDYDDPTV